MMKRLLLLFITVVMFVGCTSKKSAQEFTGTWEVVQIGNTEISKAGELPYMTFDLDKKEVNGNLGCNDFGAKLELGDPNLIQFGDIATTRMACEDMSIEAAIALALKEVKQYEFAEDGTVSLLKEDGTRLLLLRRKA